MYTNPFINLIFCRFIFSRNKYRSSSKRITTQVKSIRQLLWLLLFLFEFITFSLFHTTHVCVLVICEVVLHVYLSIVYVRKKRWTMKNTFSVWPYLEFGLESPLRIIHPSFLFRCISIWMTMMCSMSCIFEFMWIKFYVCSWQGSSWASRNKWFESLIWWQYGTYVVKNTLMVHYLWHKTP